MSGWGRVARSDQAGRVRGIREGMHAAPSAGRDDGFERRCLRGLLQLWAVPVGGGAGWRRISIVQMISFLENAQ